jgi:hypothetical protein
MIYAKFSIVIGEHIIECIRKRIAKVFTNPLFGKAQATMGFARIKPTLNSATHEPLFW